MNKFLAGPDLKDQWEPCSGSHSRFLRNRVTFTKEHVYAASESKARRSEMTSMFYACLLKHSLKWKWLCLFLSPNTPKSILVWVADTTLNCTCKYSNYAWKIRGQLEASGRFGLFASRFWNSRLYTTHCLPPRPCYTHLPGSHFTISILLKRNPHTMVILANWVLFPKLQVVPAPIPSPGSLPIPSSLLDLTSQSHRGKCLTPTALGFS